MSHGEEKGKRRNFGTRDLTLATTVIALGLWLVCTVRMDSGGFVLALFSLGASIGAYVGRVCFGTKSGAVAGFILGGFLALMILPAIAPIP